MRLAAPLAIAVLAAALMAGCGDSSEDTGTVEQAPRAQGSTAPVGAAAHECEARVDGAKDLRATNLSCSDARRLLKGWQRESTCAVSGEAGRDSCKVSGYRCLAAVTERGVSVSCARPGRSIAFTAKRA